MLFGKIIALKYSLNQITLVLQDSELEIQGFQWYLMTLICACDKNYLYRGAL